MLTLEALIEAAKYKDQIDSLRAKARKDSIDIQDTIDKLEAGKFTFGGMLKSDNEKKASAVAKKEVKVQLEADIVNYDTLKHFLSIYLSTVAIPNFKE